MIPEVVFEGDDVIAVIVVITDAELEVIDVFAVFCIVVVSDINK